jgi:hypothetical protein
MKRLIAVALLAALTGCGSGSAPPVSLAGAWTRTTQDRPRCLTLRADGMGSLDSFPIAWRASKGTLTVYSGQWEDSAAYSVTPDTLTITGESRPLGIDGTWSR